MNFSKKKKNNNINTKIDTTKKSKKEISKILNSLFVATGRENKKIKFHIFPRNACVQFVLISLENTKVHLVGHQLLGKILSYLQLVSIQIRKKEQLVPAVLATSLFSPCLYFKQLRHREGKIYSMTNWMISVVLLTATTVTY